MGFWDRLFKGRNPPEQQDVVMINGKVSAYSDIGDDVMLSNVVRAAINAIARESSKLIVQSVVKRKSPVTYELQDDDITRLFEYAPNPIMTAQEFWSQVAMLRAINENVFILPEYETLENGTKVFKAFWPLMPQSAEFLEAEGAELYIRLTIGTQRIMLPYAEIIHLRRNFGRNPLLGGNVTGRPNAEETQKAASAYSRIVQMIPDVMESSMQFKMLFKSKSTIGADKLRNERDRLIELLNTAKNGVAAVDLAGELIPFNINPQMIDKTTMEFLRDDMLLAIGVSSAIISGDYSDDQYAAFYQSCIEDFIIDVEQAFTMHCYTRREREQGHRVKVSDRLVQHLSIKTRIEIVKEAAPAGYVSEDEVRELLGFEPRGSGITRQSLNWADTKIASTYQMTKAQKGEPITDGRENT